MLAARKLPDVLRTALSDGVEGCCLMTAEGSSLCAVLNRYVFWVSLFPPPFISFHLIESNLIPLPIILRCSDSILTETSLAAISSSIYNNYVLCAPDISLHMTQLEYGCIAITSASRGYVLSAYGRTASAGLLKARLEALGVYFQRVFEQLK